MFTTFHVLHYKGLQLDELSLGRLNLLVGPNNCGKSNLLSALSLVWELAEVGESVAAYKALMERRAPIRSLGAAQAPELRWRTPEAAEAASLHILEDGMHPSRLQFVLGRAPPERSLFVHHASLVPREIARPQAEADVDRLDPRGLQLVNLLAGQLTREGHAARLATELRPLFPGLTELRVFSGGGYRWVQLQLHGRWKNLAELSDGSVSLLLLATLLFAPVAQGVLCLDEPELNLHPAWARVVAGWLARQTAWSQVFVATHSPELMDPLTELFAQGDVRLFVFQPRGDGFVLESRAPEPLAALLREGYLLGDLYRIGEPALGGWPW